MKTLLLTSSLIIASFLTATAQTYTVAGISSDISTPANPHSFSLTPELNNVVGAVWNNTMVNLNTNSFMITYDLMLGSDDFGADGSGFVLQTITPSSTLVGNNGDAMGFGISTSCYNNNTSPNCGLAMTPSLAIEFDTHANANDPLFDHIAMVQNGDTRGTRGFPLLAPAVQMDATKPNVEDGGQYPVMITWDHINKVLAVDFDGSRRITYTNDIVNTVFGGNSNIYWGLTGATGSRKNLQLALNLSVVYFGPLPVQMAAFNVKKTTENEAFITWSTASESNNSYFTVQRSADGLVYQNIVTVSSENGNSTSTKNYSTLDRKPLSGVSYYRIKQTDINGKSTTSRVLPFSNEGGATEMSVVLYPVPTSTMLNIDLTSTVNETALVQIYDMSGKLIINTSQDVNEGASTFTIATEDLPIGLYLLKVYSPSTNVMTIKQFTKN